MFVLSALGMARPLPEHAVPALAVALTLPCSWARPAAVFFCLAPFRFSWREKLFISWVGCAARSDLPRLDPVCGGLPKAQLFFDVGSWWCWSRSWCRAGASPSRAPPAHRAGRHDPLPRRVELDLHGQAAQKSSAIRSAPPVLSAAPPDPVMARADAGGARGAHPDAGRPIRCARATISICSRRPKRRKRSIASSSTCRRRSRPIPHLLGDSSSPAKVTLGRARRHLRAVGRAADAATSLADHLAERLARAPRPGDALPVGAIVLVVHRSTAIASVRRLAVPEDETSDGRQASSSAPAARAPPASVSTIIEAAARRHDHSTVVRLGPVEELLAAHRFDASGIDRTTEVAMPGLAA